MPAAKKPSTRARKPKTAAEPATPLPNVLVLETLIVGNIASGMNVYGPGFQAEAEAAHAALTAAPLPEGVESRELGYLTIAPFPA